MNTDELNHEIRANSIFGNLMEKRSTPPGYLTLPKYIVHSEFTANGEMGRGALYNKQLISNRETQADARSQQNILINSSREYSKETKIELKDAQHVQMRGSSIVSPKTVPRLITKGISSSAFQRAWAAGYTGKDIVVAVVDTGIDKNHPDLANKVIRSINLTNEPITESHGTHVAGTIAANGWLVGGAYDAKLMDIKVIGRSGGSIANIAKAIGLAAASGASVVNMSLGGVDIPQPDINTLNVTIQDAWNKGTVCIAAAGNDGTSICTPDVYEYPASIEKAESIAACNIDESLNGISLAYFSNENNRVDLGACGVNVASSIIGGRYAIYSGTSMATPHVAAMAAILAQFIRTKYPTLTGSTFSAALVSLIHSNVLKIPACGVGISNLDGASIIQQMVEQPCIAQMNTTELSVKYQNISFGLGFLRYEPNAGPVVPNGQKFYSSGIFLGHIINQ
ncbi:Serine peptidase S8 family [uncultured virus]|nr:Serine peptidase S8 family [uncultured virus]